MADAFHTDRPRRRIAIASNGRFHVLDLARELVALGHEVRFYSMLRDGRVEAFGLDRRNARSLFATVAPFTAWDTYAPKLLPGLRARASRATLNWSVMRKLEPCDVFIGMSGLILEAAERAREQFGALIYLERGSTHIEAQRETLGKGGPTDFDIARELAGYRLADRIVIPADHVGASFVRDPSLATKLFSNPYGVDLALFPQRAAPHDGPPTLIFAGNWSWRKGADLVTRVMEQLPDVRLLHVGALGDYPFPAGSNRVSLGKIDQRALGEQYRRADCLFLPSREEGLALVQVQAMASGLPIICSEHSGGRDLGYTDALRARISEVPGEDVDGLVAAVRQRMTQRETLPPLPEADRALLSWHAYGERYATQIERDLAR